MIKGSRIAIVALIVVPYVKPISALGNTATHGASYSAAELRAVTARDLVQLRDLDAIAVSPDGRRVAFHVLQASIAENGYRGGWYVVDLGQQGSSELVGDAGLLRPRPGPAGFIVTGVRPTSVARWSPDARYLAYLKEQNGEIQLWASDMVNGGQKQLTHHASDVVEFEWSSTDSKIYFKTLLNTRAGQIAKKSSEGEAGFYYDQRFTPSYSVSPRTIRAVSDDIWIYDLKTSRESKATSRETEDYERQINAVQPPPRLNARHVAVSGDNRHVAWAQPLTILDDGSIPFSPTLQLMSAHSDSIETATVCGAPVCRGLIYDVWPNSDDTEVYFSRREGHNLTEFGYYAWEVQSGNIRTLYSRPDEWLTDCNRANGRLVCFYETPTQPRRLATVGIHDGSFEILFDANPEFRQIRFGEVRRINWTNNEFPWAREGFGHLVLPLDYNPKKTYPLVITQYHSSGFLRGGVGDEYPVHLLAANGIAVLSYQKPFPWELFRIVSDADEMQRRLFTHDQNDWDIGLQSLETGLDEVLATGLIDPKRVGITGLSDGAVKAFHGLVNSSDRYAAASVSGVGWNPILFFTTDFDRRRSLKKWGLQDPYESDSDLWRRISPTHNIREIEAPILLHIADHELINAAQVITMLSEASKPFDAYVFPDEYHAKWQPKHRDAIYRRNVDWFRFWLLGDEDSDQAKATQYERWRGLRRLSDYQVE